MTTFKIMQAPGPSAIARRKRWDTIFSPPMKRVGQFEAAKEEDALQGYVEGRYVATGNKQYRGHRMQRRYRGRWVGGQRVGREQIRVAVTLANGAYVHDIFLEAWAAGR